MNIGNRLLGCSIGPVSYTHLIDSWSRPRPTKGCRAMVDDEWVYHVFCIFFCTCCLWPIKKKKRTKQFCIVALTFQQLPATNCDGACTWSIYRMNYRKEPISSTHINYAFQKMKKKKKKKFFFLFEKVKTLTLLDWTSGVLLPYQA